MKLLPNLNEVIFVGEIELQDMKYRVQSFDKPSGNLIFTFAILTAPIFPPFATFICTHTTKRSMFSFRNCWKLI